MYTRTHAPTALPPDPDPFLTLRQAADEQQCHEATLRRLIRAGVLRHARVGLGRKHIRIRRSWLQEAMTACTPVEARR